MSERGREFLADLVLAWMPFLMVFIAVPIAIYVPNQLEFEYKLSTVGTLIAIGAAMLIPLLMLYFVKPPARVWIAHGLFFLGLLILLSDMIAPLQWGQLDGDEKLREPTNLTLIQAALAIGLVSLWIYLPSRLVRALGVPLVFTVLTFQLLLLARAVPTASASTLEVHADPASTAKMPNVYQFVFDGYSSLNFLMDLETNGLRDDLDGFVFFPRNMANYPETDASVPSFMTGRLFTGGSFKQFQINSRTAGLRRTLQDHGYRISVYSPDTTRFWMYDGASYVQTGQQLAERLYGNTSAQRLAQVTFVRVAPNILRREAFNASEGFFTRVAEFERLLASKGGGRDILDNYSFYKSLSVPLVRQFIADEKSRPESGQYVFLHVILPHSPFVWDASCQFMAKSSYVNQSLCASKLMGEIVAELKRLGRYDNSLIIFQSDHGMKNVTDSHGVATFDSIPDDIAEHAATVNSNYAGEGLWGRFHALLAVKPPSAEEAEIQVSQSQTQLIDISPTIFDVLDIEMPNPEGQSVLSLSESSEREIHVFTGIHFKAKGSRDKLILGRDLKELSLAHLGYKPGRGWRLYPDVPATHEGW